MDDAIPCLPLLRVCCVFSKMYDASNKVVLVTGGAAGIGSGVVRAFLNQGAKHVAVLDLDINSGKALEEELISKHGENKVKFYKCDVTTEDLTAAFDGVIQEFKYIDVVVNCAGLLNDSPNVYLKEITVNVSALITSSLKAYKLMREDKGGRGGTIINISSIVGLLQSALLPIYAATKTAVLQFSNGLGMELNYSRSKVRVLTICFGCTDTTLLQPGKMEALDKDLEQQMFDVMKNFPFQTPESAVRGLMEAYKIGKSGTTWLVTSNKPAQNISEDITQGFGIMSKRIFEK